MKRAAAENDPRRLFLSGQMPETLVIQGKNKNTGLRFGIVPFIIDDRHKMFCYRGLKEWDKFTGYLRDPCLLMQDDLRQSWITSVLNTRDRGKRI